jgi:hypothetical protein
MGSEDVCEQKICICGIPPIGIPFVPSNFMGKKLKDLHLRNFTPVCQATSWGRKQKIFICGLIRPLCAKPSNFNKEENKNLHLRIGIPPLCAKQLPLQKQYWIVLLLKCY